MRIIRLIDFRCGGQNSKSLARLKESLLLLFFFFGFVSLATIICDDNNDCSNYDDDDDLKQFKFKLVNVHFFSVKQLTN